MAARSFVVFVQYTDANGKIVTVDAPFESHVAAERHVLQVFRDGYLFVIPTPPMQDDGLRRIYIPVSRIISVHTVEQQET